ncbi:hypothetical protein M8J76_002843 [Diaphorina citri]|nr:hypothetical protein M8J76_002843 [Diaphorina citri]
MSDSEEEDAEFVLYGTQLDPIEEDEVQARKPINVQDQIATDKHGKRRFHGAFTGGFSAGFCNTVGSLEGWTPSTFKSSRSERAATIQASAQLPEHFMDEEDMAEFGIAPKRIQIASSYEANAEGARRQRGQGTGTIPGVPVLETLLEPVPDTIGIKLLRRMGWKPGQGIGPRLSRREKQAATARDLSRPKVYGCAMPGDREGTAGKGQEEEEEEEEEEECESGFTYAPNEYVQYLVKPKDDEFGLGYKGLDRKPVLSSEKRGFNLFDLDEPPGRNEAQDSGVTFIGRNNKKIKIHGQAFGVGAFEVEDDDIYATEDMSRYDTSLAPTGTRAPREPKSKPRGPKEPREGELEGFHLCEAQCVFGKFFPPPVLPPNYVPRAPALGTALRTPANSLPPDIPGDHPIKHARSAFERAAILDELLPFVTPVDSGLSGIPAVQRGSSGVPAVESGIPAMQSGSSSVPPAGGNRLTGNTTKAETKERPQGENGILAKEGHSVGSTFRPFANDPDKQKRYEQYITFVKLGVKDRLAQIQPPSMTEWERQREAQEFASAHALYLPLSGAMADRFTRGSQADDTNPLVKVEKSIDPGDETLRNAAKSKMFGKLTRELSVWVPSDLLCKRFNIKPPVFDYKNPAVQKKRRNTNYSLFEFLNNPNEQAVQSGPNHQLNEEAAQTGSSQSNEGQAGPSSQVSNDRVSKNWGERLPNPLRDEDEKLGKQAVNPEPARRLEDIPAVNPEPARRLEDIPLTAENKVDLFKAIFLSSDEEDEPDPEPNEDQKHLDPKDKTEEDNQNNTNNRDSTNNIRDNTKNQDITNINLTNTDNHEGTSQSCDKTVVANPMQSMDREMRGNCDRQTGLGPARPNSSQEGSESAQMGNESAQMGSESAQMGNESAQMWSESAQMGQNSKEIEFNPVIRPQSNQMISENNESPYGPRLPGQASDTSSTTKNIPSAKTNAMSAPEETSHPNSFDVHTTTHSLRNSEVMGIRFEKPAAKDAKTKDPSGGADAKAIAGVKADGGVANSKSEETDDGDMWVDADEVSSDEKGNSGSERSRKEKRKSREGLTKSQSKARNSRSNERRKKNKDRKGRRRKHSESSSDSEGGGKTSESRGRKRKSKRKHESSEEEEERRKNKGKGDEEEEKRRKGRRKEDSSDSERHAKSSHRKKERRKRDSESEGEIRHKSKRKHYSSDSDSEGEKRHKSKKKHYSSDDDDESGDKKRKSKKARYSSDSDSEGEKRHKSKKKYYSSDSEEDKRRTSKKKKHKKRSKR